MALSRLHAPSLTLATLIALTGIAVWLPVLAFKSAVAAPQPSSAPQKIVIHFSKSEGENSLHSALMGLGMATAMQRMGAAVTVVLDSEGPSLAKQTWAGKFLAPHDLKATMSDRPKRTLGVAFQQFVDAGGTIVMCPHCAAGCGCEIGNLVAGARFAQEGELARVIFEADKVLDY